MSEPIPPEVSGPPPPNDLSDPDNPPTAVAVPDPEPEEAPQ
jgi:hypothetical protein